MPGPEPAPPFAVTFVQRLRDDLLVARKARDGVSTTVLRTTIAAIENAEAPPADGPAWPPQIGLSTDHARLELAEEQVLAIVERERAERVRGAAELDEVGQAERAAELRAEADVLLAYLDPG